MLTPVAAAGQGLVRAYLQIESPPGVDDPIIPFKFNPTEYQVQKSNTFAEIGIPGLETPPIQFIRGAAETLTVELLVDTSDTLEHVGERYANRLRDLMNINSELHAPPILSLVWDRQVFRGVLESLGITYVLFSPEGVPLRARVNLTLKEYRPVEVQVRDRPTASPDFDKIHVVRRGDTLSRIAAAVYRDPALWRTIADANEIRDPRTLKPGDTLTVPRLR